MPHARCSRCQARRTLARNPDQYARLPNCQRCGHNRYYLDHYRRNVERNKKAVPVCNPGRGGCSAYHFPHRKGSGFCIHNDKLTDEKLRAREESIDMVACPF